MERREHDISSMQYGFIPDEVKIEDYTFGASLPTTPLVLDGNWEQYLPVKEYQRQNGLETSNCTAYGSLNAIETMIKRLMTEQNYSERFVGTLAGTTEVGNSPHTVLETIRKKGLIPETMLPFTTNINTWEEYYAPDPMTEPYLSEGLKWVSEFEFKHEWVFSPTDKLTPEQKKERMKEALTCSPIGVSVRAWQTEGDIYVKHVGTQDNHWCMVYKIDDEGFYWVYDSYDNTKKKLAPHYDFQFAKRFYLEPRVENEQQALIENIINSIIQLLQKLAEVLKLKV